MRKAKKALILFMALAVICSSLIGCQSQSSSGSSDVENSKTSEVLSNTGSDLEQETLNYWIVGPGKQKDSDKVWEQFNKEIQEKLPNTTVDFTVITGAEYATKWAAAMAAQEPVDLAWTGWMLSIPDEANKGSLMPLSDLLDEYGQDVISSLGQKVIDIHRISDGEIYQIPVWQGLVGNRTAFRFPQEVVALAGENYTQELQQLCYDTWDTPTVEARSKVYAEQGCLDITKGQTIDYSRVRDYITSIDRLYNVQYYCGDPWHLEILKQLCGEQIARKFIEIPQTIAGMAPGMSELERQFRAGEISHRPNSLGRFCFDCVVVNPDGNENIKPMKNKSKGRIDPIVALINAASAAIKLEQKRSVFEERGLRSLA